MLDIRFNNNKEFMAAHRAQYQRVMRDPHYRFIEALTPTMLSIDPQMEVRPHKALSRIFRDTRFTHDKSPYRDHHWIAFRRVGEPRDQSIMFWFEARVESVSWGLGFWGENRPAMDVFRRRMVADPTGFQKVLEHVTDTGLRLAGDTYKRMKLPEELPEALHPWYLRKELLVIRDQVDNSIILTEKLLPTVIADFQKMAPLYQLLRGCYEISLVEGN